MSTLRLGISDPGHICIQTSYFRAALSLTISGIRPNIKRFSVHVAVKDFGSRPGMDPNNNRFSVHFGVKHFEARTAYIQTSGVSTSTLGASISEPGLAHTLKHQQFLISCCSRTEVSVTLFGRESRISTHRAHIIL